MNETATNNTQERFKRASSDPGGIFGGVATSNMIHPVFLSESALTPTWATGTLVRGLKFENSKVCILVSSFDGAFSLTVSETY